MNTPNYPICNICNEENPGVFPPWDALLHICATCPRRVEFLRKMKKENQSVETSMTGRIFDLEPSVLAPDRVLTLVG